jgi:hypothetical protein
MVIKLTDKQYKALTFEYLPHMMLHLDEMHLDIIIVEKGTIVVYSTWRGSVSGEDQKLLISSESPEFIDDFINRQVQAWEICEEVAGEAQKKEGENGTYDPVKHLSKQEI